MQAILWVAMLLQVLAPAKTWFAPSAPIPVKVSAEGDGRLVLTDFAGRALDPKGPADVSGEKTINLRDVFPQQLGTPGTYVLYVTAKDGDVSKFSGTPLVIGVRESRRRGTPPGPMVVKVEPLRYAVMTTKEGRLTMAFYYDVAPNTVTSFLTLSEEGFYDGLTFHRIVPGFVIQGGDPRGDGTGGPGYTINAEFSGRLHNPGVLSMARNGDPMEASGAPPRPEFANSAGSQFFICLDHEKTKSLDGKYAAFGQVVDGMDAVNAIAKTPIADRETGRPVTPPVIEKVEVKLVTAKENPYLNVLKPPAAPVP